MVKIIDISEDDLIKYKDIFTRAEMLFGWSSGDAKKVIVDEKEIIIFCYHPMYMFFSYDANNNLEYKSCVANDNGKIISITIDNYQVNIGDNSIYLIDESGRHQSLELICNKNMPDFEVSANGLLTYMQYDSKRDIRLVIRYDKNVYEDGGRIYSEYLREPFYLSIESKPKLRDKGFVFLGKKDSFYRLDFDVWNNKWQYDLATIGEYGVFTVLARDAISLHGGIKEFSRYYKQLFSVSDYFSVTSFPFGKQYKIEDIECIIESLNFNKKIPQFVGYVYNEKEKLKREFQVIIDEYFKLEDKSTLIK